MRSVWINNPDYDKIRQAFIELNAKRVHINRESNGSYHDYSESWTLVRAGKTSRSGLTLKQVLVEVDRYVTRAVQNWSISRDA